MGSDHVGGDAQAEQRKRQAADDEQGIGVRPQITQVVDQHAKHGQPLDQIEPGVALHPSTPSVNAASAR
ncbi:hypothetical protein D9M69_613710 [compost metagenome]